MIKSSETNDDLNLCHHCKETITSNFAYCIQLWHQYQQGNNVLVHTLYPDNKYVRVFFCEGCWVDVAGTQYCFERKEIR